MISTWKEFVEILPIELQEVHKEAFRKMFSICARNYWNLLLKDGYIEISRVSNNIKLYAKIGIPTTTAKFSVGKIILNNIEYLETGYKLVVPSDRRSYCVINTDGDAKFINGYFDNSAKILQLGSNIVKVIPTSEYRYSLLGKHEFFRKLTYEESRSYGSFVLCIKDIADYKKGMIIDKSDSMYNTPYYNGNPLLKFNGWYGEEQLSCNLNLVTYEQLSKINTEVKCEKRQFGCPRGCLTYCQSENGSNYKKRLKELYMKLYLEIFGDEK